MMTRLFPLLLLTALNVSAADPIYERVLIPLQIKDVPGAFGTLWSTELVVRNEGEVPALIFDQVCWYECHCGTSHCIFYRATAPHERAKFVGGAGDLDFVFPGTFVHVEKTRAADVFFSLRLYEESRRATEFGVEVPVVRERDFLTSRTWLVNVPTVTTSRVHLRVYGLESPSGEGVVRIRIYSGDALDARYDQLLPLRPSHLSRRIPAPGDHNEVVPGIGVLYLSPEITGDATTVRLSIEPVTPELRFWAMASITSNTTQNVTLVTPQ
jgi:hypothetical protein